MTMFRTMSGTPSIDLIPFSRRIGLRTCAWSTSGRITGRRSAATVPAKPSPTGMRTPASTSSSSPTAERATSSFRSGSSRRTAHVSTPRISLMRTTSVSSNTSSSRCASAASVIACSCPTRPAPAEVPTRTPLSTHLLIAPQGTPTPQDTHAGPIPPTTLLPNQKGLDAKQLVPQPADGHEALWPRRVALDLPAQIGDVHLARVLVADVVARPQVLHELAAGYDPLRLLGQERQHLDLRQRQAHGLPVDGHLVADEIEMEAT